MLIILLLAAICWLLWTIHQDLMESNDRQRTLKTELTKLDNRLEQALGSVADDDSGKKKPSAK